MRPIIVHRLPLRNVPAFCDVASRELFIGPRFFDGADEHLLHEVAHLVSGQVDHGCAFRGVLDELDGRQPPEFDVFAELRKRHVVASEISANVGNITGISQILLNVRPVRP